LIINSTENIRTLHERGVEDIRKWIFFKIAVFWYVAPYSLISMMVEAASTSETSVNFTTPHGVTSKKTAIFILAAVRT
jgi:hypothetical protein